VTTEDYLAALDGHPIVSPAGERFAYNNGGYVVLALIAERVSGMPYHDLVAARVTEPAGMADTRVSPLGRTDRTGGAELPRGGRSELTMED
jgi:CubicO group peptidase (beta-lactamase class C family)